MPVYVLLVTSFKDVAETDPSHAWSWPHAWTTTAWHQAGRAFAEPEEQLLPRDPGDDPVDDPRLAERVRPVEVALPGVRRRLHLLSLRDVHPVPGGDDSADAALPTTGDTTFPEGIPRLVFAHVVYGIPITALIFRSYYATIPEELMEAARMDRAGMLRTYWSVVLPHLGAGLRRRSDLAVHVDLERLPLRRVHHHRPCQVARDGRAEQHDGLLRHPVQPADGGRPARVAARR